MTRDELWKRALDDAGMTEVDAIWREIPGSGDPRTDTLAFSLLPGQFLGPEISVPETVKEWSKFTEIDKIRVLLYSDPAEAEAVLAQMRWALEDARLKTDYPAALTLVAATHIAHQDRVVSHGPGGAVYHHHAPEQRQHNAAASALVEKTFGKPLGKLHGYLGPLYRNADDLKSDAVFPKRAVAFAAFHASDLAAAGTDVSELLSAVDPAAEAWYEALVADPEFAAYSEVAPFLMPDLAETEEADTPSALWAASADMLVRAEDRALALLG